MAGSVTKAVHCRQIFPTDLPAPAEQTDLLPENIVSSARPLSMAQPTLAYGRDHADVAPAKASPLVVGDHVANVQLP